MASIWIIGVGEPTNTQRRASLESPVGFAAVVKRIEAEKTDDLYPMGRSDARQVRLPFLDCLIRYCQLLSHLSLCEVAVDAGNPEIISERASTDRRTLLRLADTAKLPEIARQLSDYKYPTG